MGADHPRAVPDQSGIFTRLPLEEDGFEPSVPFTGYPVSFAKGRGARRSKGSVSNRCPILATENLDLEPATRSVRSADFTRAAAASVFAGICFLAALLTAVKAASSVAPQANDPVTPDMLNWCENTRPRLARGRRRGKRLGGRVVPGHRCTSAPKEDPHL
jgi:hypothetical protein